MVVVGPGEAADGATWVVNGKEKGRYGGCWLTCGRFGG